MGLKSELLSITALSQMDRDRMFQLMVEHYDNIKYCSFRNDLMEKDSVLILKDEEGILQGFTTIKIFEYPVNDVPVRLAFSGDTIIDKDHWGSLELHRSWIRAVYSLVGGDKGEAYWLLISKGYKTYRFLPVYFHSFYPCYDKETPEFEKKIIDTFCKYRHHEYYKADKGVICFNGEKDFLKKGIADISEKHMKDPHIKFFVTRNPGYLMGDELVCLTKLNSVNMRSMVLRYLQEERLT